MTDTDRATTVQPTLDEEMAHCGRCSMRVRRSEMQIHLAHAHNIGPAREKDKKKPRRRDG